METIKEISKLINAHNVHQIRSGEKHRFDTKKHEASTLELIPILEKDGV